MKQSYTRGGRWLIIFTLVMTITSGFAIKYTVNGFKSPENLYNEGEYFDGSRGRSIIKVLEVGNV